MLAVAASVLLAVPPSAGAQSGGGLEVELPSNTDCRGAAVIAKTTVVEDAAAANMLAEALRALSPGGAQRCLLDAGLPPGRGRPPNEGVPPDAVYRSSAGLAETVYVVGGPDAIPDWWLAEQFGVSETGFTRVAGADRWQTQQSVAAAMLALARDKAVQPYRESVAAATRALPPNGDCWGTAVLAKLTVAEERAAANMLAAALTAISGDPNSRCLVDVGDPGADRPPSAVAVADAAQASGAYLLGGEVAVPQPWIDGGFDIRFLERISGLDRWATQSAVAETIIDIAQGGTLPHQYEVNDSIFSVHGRQIFVASSSTSELKEFDLSDNVEIEVHYCGRKSGLDNMQKEKNAKDYLESEVKGINDHVAHFLRHQLGDAIDFKFEAGDTVGVGTEIKINDRIHNVIWDGVFNNDDNPHDGNGEVNASYACLHQLGLSVGTHTGKFGYVLIDQECCDGPAGFAYVGYGAAIQPVRKRVTEDSYTFYNIFAHEIGHAFLHLCHPHHKDDPNDSRPCPKGHNDLAYEKELEDLYDGAAYDLRPGQSRALCSIMSYCTSIGNVLEYNQPDDDNIPAPNPVFFACGQRRLALEKLQLELIPDGPPIANLGYCENGEFKPTSQTGTPGRPGKPVLSELDTDFISITWREASGVVAYHEVNWRRADSGSSWQTRTLPNSLAIFGTHGLSSAVCYEFRVRAGNGAGASDWSPSAEFCTEETEEVVMVPDPPSRPSATADDGQSTVSWNAPSGNGAAVAGYEVRWRRRSSGSWDSRTVTVRSYTILGLSNGSQYEVQVRARNSEGWSDWSLPPVFVTLPPEVVGSVVVSEGPVNSSRTSAGSCSGNDCYDLSYTIRNLGSGPYTLECWFNGSRAWRGQWSGNASTGCYYSAAFSGSAYVVIDDVKSNTLTIAEKSQRNRVRVPDAPGAPNVTPGNGQLSVSWNAPSGNGASVSGYEVQWRRGSGSWDSQTVGATSYTIRGLRNGSRYEVQVRARNSEGWGGWSWSGYGTPTEPRQVGSVRISEGPVNSSRTSAGSCSGNDCYDLSYTIRNLGGGPYTLECWFNGSRAWRGQWSGNASTGCYYSAAFSGSAYVVIDDVKSNTLSISAKASTQQSTEKVTITRGSRNSRSNCVSPCYDLDYRIEGLGGGPYTLECWFNGSRAWRGQWSGRASRGCYFSGSFRGTVHVVIDGIKSNTLTF